MGKITVRNIGKSYKKYPTRFSRFRDWLFPSPNNFQEKWIIRNVNFTVGSGESVGIIGMNGAGKSTLLKLITGTIKASEGSVSIEGRISALLELGMGFHPDFTGRQNIYMSSQLIGLTTSQIDSLVESIENFAEIGEYIDQPVRVYSSGMQVRLAFSAATALRPDILIVDEALSVGDAYFQHKSFERIRKFHEEGTTLLFVTHSADAIKSICNRALLINAGSLEKDGDPEEVLDYYNAALASKQKQNIKQITVQGGKLSTISGTGEAKITSIDLLCANRNSLNVVEVGQRVQLVITAETFFFIKQLVLGYAIKDRYGRVIYGTNTFLKNKIISDVPKNKKINYCIEFDMNLGPGNYSIQVALTSSDTHLANNYEWRDLALVFSVVNTKMEYFAGTCWIDPEIRVIE
jgi:lipopolysaccharide transport system ATP-binding protein